MACHQLAYLICSSSTPLHHFLAPNSARPSGYLQIELDSHMATTHLMSLPTEIRLAIYAQTPHLPRYSQIDFYEQFDNTSGAI